MKLKILVANVVWFLYSAMRTITWNKSCGRVRVTQEEILKKLLRKNKHTVFGELYNFDKIDSVTTFQNAVPIQSYEEVSQYVQDIAAGKKEVLTAESVKRFGVSSGSTGASKLVPYTESLVVDFQHGIDPWIYHLMKQYPKTLFGTTYWSVTPVGSKAKYSTGGIPIGFDDERSYFGKLTQWVFESIMSTPSELAQIQDMDAFRYTTLLFLLQEKSLSWVSIWNPTFVTLFLEPLPKLFNRLVEDIRTGSISIDLGVNPKADLAIRSSVRKSPKRAQELVDIQKRNEGNFYEQIWPNLSLISCWAHGNSAIALKQLQNYFPNVAIQPKGLIATEAFVSFPLFDEASALSINSHFFEFEDVVDKTIVLAHETKVGERYSVIVTTNGGLYRYRLNDVIEILGFEKQCPLIRFVGRQDKVVDICGEKLNEQFVATAVGQLIHNMEQKPCFWMIAPTQLFPGCYQYTLFVQYKADAIEIDEGLRKLGGNIDHLLKENFHYDYCRRLGQLKKLNVFLIDNHQDASTIYLHACTEMGQRLGDIKSVALHPYQKWQEYFRGRFI